MLSSKFIVKPPCHRWSVVAAISTLSLIACSTLPLNRQTPTPSVNQFAYDSGNSASVRSRVHSGRPLRFEEVRLPGLPDDALRFMPLLWKPPGTAQRWLIFSTRDYQLKAYDLDQRAVAWKVKLISRAFSTPFLDIDKGLIYSGTRQLTENPKEEYGFDHHLHEITTSGKLVNACSLKLDAFFAARGLFREKWRSRIHCKTAIGRLQSSQGNQVFFGCSINTGTDPLIQYGDTKGLTGLVISFPLDQDGHLTNCNGWKAFATSQLAAEPWLGFDTGVYSLGSKPAILDDASMLIATGNGPVDFSRENFGCSVVRVKPDLTVHRRTDQVISGFSVSPAQGSECWTMNDEYSNSAVAVVTTANGPLAGIVEKYGRMTLFDPNHMEPTKKDVIEIERGAGWGYGQPAAIPLVHGGARFFFQQAVEPRKLTTDTLLATEELAAQLSSQARQMESTCFGYTLETAGSKATKELTLFYSGVLRNDYAVALNDTKGARELTSFQSRMGDSGKDLVKKGLWVPYEKVTSLGHLPTMRSDLLRHQPANSSIEVEVAVWKNEVEHLQSPHGQPHWQGRPYYYFRPRAPTKTCPSLREFGLKSIYEVHLPPKPTIERDMIMAYDYDGKAARPAWEVSLGSDERLSRAHPAVSTDSDGQRPVLVVSIEKPLQVPLKSVLLFVDGETGKVLSRIEYAGKMHFSMPLIFDEMVIIPTVDDGLKTFRLLD